MMYTTLKTIVVCAVLGFALLIATGPAAHAQCGGNATVVPAGAPDGGQLGASVAVRGGEIVVGAPGVGRVYMYRRQLGATPYALVGQLARPATVDGGDEFGRSVAMDYDICAVGAPIWADGQGAVAVYRRNAAGAWSFLQLLTAPVQQPGMNFGSSIALSNGFLAVGAPGGLNGSNFSTGIVYMFVRLPDGTFAYQRPVTPSNPNAQVDGQFGQCVALSAGTLVVGAPGELYSGDTRRGSLYVFRRGTDGAWPLVVRAKSQNSTNTTHAFAIDCAVDGPFIAAREQSSTGGAADTIWLYTLSGQTLSLEPSFTAGRSDAFAFDPAIDANLTGKLSICEGYMAVGSPTAERCDLYVRGAAQWSLQTPYNSGSAGNIDLGAGVALGHDILAMGMPQWVEATNYEPGALWALAHVTRNCDADSDSDACEVMSQANSAFDDDFDGIPDNCEATTSPTAAIGSLGTVVNGVVVSWAPVATASGYRVQRSLGASTVVAGWPYAPEFTDTGAAPDTLYTYIIRSVDGANGFGPGSVSTTGWRPYSAPTGLTASDGSSGAHVALVWNAVSGAPAYRVFRAIGTGTPVEISQTTATTYNDTTASAGVVYTYTVKVKGNLGDSPASNADTGYRVGVGVPGNVQASDGASTANVQVSWTGVTNATNYRVFRAINGGSPAELGTVAAGVLSYTDTTAVALTQYSYTVAAVVNAVLGSPSVADTGWRNIAAPAGVGASDGDFANMVRVSWTAVAGATGYTVWRAPVGQTLVQVAGIGASAPTYDDTSAAPGTTYTYAVRASHALGATATSATNTGWRNLEPPTGLTASDGAHTDRIRVTWKAVPGAIGYRLLRLLPGGSETPLPDLAAGVTQFDDTSAAALGSVRYRIRAISTPGTTFPSVADFGWRNVPGPASVVASQGTRADGIDVAWAQVPQATAYRVRRSTNGGPWVVIGTARPEETSLSDGQAQPLAQVAYTIAAVHALGETPPSAPGVGWMNARAPVVEASDGLSTQGVQVKWVLMNSAVGFDVYRGTSPESLALVATVGPNMTSWRDLTIEPAAEYFYALRCRHSLGATDIGAANSGWRGIHAPEDVTASDGLYKDYVAVDWKAVPLATGYIVERCIATAHGPVETFGPLPTASWKDKTAVPGVRYRYIVKSVCSLGSSVPSANDQGWRIAGEPSLGSGGELPGLIEAPGSVAGDEAPGGDGNHAGVVGPVVGDDSDFVAPDDDSMLNAAPVFDASGRQLREVLVARPHYYAGDVTVPATVRMTVVLRDAADAGESGAVLAHGDVHVDGVLRLAVATGTRVRAGDSWVIAAGGRVLGAFDAVQLPPAERGITWEIERRETSVTVHARPTGGGH